MSSSFDSQTDAMSSVINPYYTPELEVVKSSGLNVGAKVFIPSYNPSLSKEEIVDLLSTPSPDFDEIRHILRSKGYPPFWIYSIVTSIERGNGLKRIRELRTIRTRREVDSSISKAVVGKSSKALAPILYDKGKGNAGGIWRIYAPKFSPVIDKPSVYTQSLFRLWVYGQACALSRALVRKTQFVTGNLACQTLFFSISHHTTTDNVSRLLEDASVFIDDYNYQSRLPKSMTLSDFISLKSGRRSLLIEDVEVTTCAELLNFEIAFRRHKPLFRAAMSYLAKSDVDEPIDFFKLQADIRTKIKLIVKIYQGKIAHPIIRIGSTTVDSFEKLQGYLHIFTGNDSLRMACIMYLCDGLNSGLDYNRIQAHLDIVVLYGRIRLDVPNVPPGIIRALHDPYRLWVEASQVLIIPILPSEYESDSELSGPGLATYVVDHLSVSNDSWFESVSSVDDRILADLEDLDEQQMDILANREHLDWNLDEALLSHHRSKFKNMVKATLGDLLPNDPRKPIIDHYFTMNTSIQEIEEATKQFNTIFPIRCVRQGNTPSINHQVKVELPENMGETIVDAIQNVAIASGSNLAHGYIRPVTQLVALFGSLHAATSWAQVITAILQFATGNDFVYSKCSSVISALYTMMEKKLFPTHQGDGFVQEWFVKPVKDFFNQEMFAEIWDTLATCSIVSLLQQFSAGIVETVLPPLKEFVMQVRISALREGAKTVVQSVLSTITDFLGVLKVCWTTKSLAPLWGEKWNPDSWAKDVESMITYYTILTSSSEADPNVSAELAKLREEGKISMFWTTPLPIGPFSARLEYFYAVGVAQRNYFTGKPAICSNISRILARLRSFIDQIVINVNGSMERVRPFGIGVWSQPGTGKTNLAKQTFKAIASLNKYDNSASGVYQWLVGANFQSGFDHTRWVVLMDDVDQGVAPPTAGIRNHIEEWLAINNNAPYPVEHADVDMKGKIFASNLVTCICSNYEDFMVSKNCRAPDAFWRRMDYCIRVVAKDDFGRGGGLLDPAKAEVSETHDMYDLYVRKFDATLSGNPDKSFIPMTPEVKYTYPQLMAELQIAFKEHLRRERANLVRRAACGAFCLTCGLDVSRNCGHPQDMPEPPLAYVAPPPPVTVVDDLETFVGGEKQGAEHLAAMATALGVAGIATQVPTLKEWVARIRAYYESLQVTEWVTKISQQITEKSRALYVPIAANLSGIRQDLRRAVALAYDARYFLAAAASVTAAVAGGAALVYFSRSYLQGRENNAVPNLLPQSWVRADQEFTPGLPLPANQATFTKDDLCKVLAQCCVSVKGPRFEMHGFLVSHNTIIVPTHVLHNPDGTMGDMIEVTHAGRVIRFQVTPLNSKVLTSNDELILIRNGEFKGTAGIASKMWEVVDESVQTFDEVEIWSSKLEYSPPTNAMKMMDATKVFTTSAVTKAGDCGMAYIARFGKAWKIVGIHYMLMSAFSRFGPSTYSVAGIVTRMELVKLAAQLGTTLQGLVAVRSTFKVDSVFDCLPYPVKSEVWAAMSHHGAQPYPLGEIYPPIAGSSMKTKVQFSLFHDLASQRFEEKWCGRPDYWRLPDFRGKMIDGKWVSPWTNMFLTQNHAQFDEWAMWMSVADYLHGIDKLDTSGYSSISEEQAIVGISGSYIGALNLRTSVGPPFNRGKRNFISVVDRRAFIDPKIGDMIDDVEAVLASDCIPATLGVACLKDEGLKPDKFPRVFTSLAAAMNITLKKRGAWKSFVRANFSFFESAVGINMTSAECNKIVQHLRSVDPLLAHLIERDAKSLDNSFSGQIWDFVALIIYAISFVIGVDPLGSYQSALGLKHTIHAIKGDLFSYFKNPSGSDWTVEVNGLTMSVGERYVYYRNRPELVNHGWILKYVERFFLNPIPDDSIPFPFRLDVAMVTYGDDVLAASKPDIPANYQAVWREEIGIIVTDASKSLDMTFKTIDQVQFLKRNLVFDSELNMYIPPLDKKSLARMLLIKKESSLTGPDHGAVALTECLKEAVYHGKSFYDEVYDFAHQAATTYNLITNPYLLLRPYEYWRTQMALGAFQTWNLREPVPAPLLQGKISFSPPSMSTPSIVNGGNDSAKNDPAPAASTNIVHDVGQMLSTSNLQSNTVSTQPKYFQTLPQNDLTDFLTRPTEIYSFSMSDADAIGNLYNFDPWALFLADTKVIEKIANYTYIRGTIEVIGMVAIPGNCYGSYVASCLPNGGSNLDSTSEIAAALYPWNAMQVDHYTRIDCAASDNFILQLPFLWPYDFASLPTGPANSWKIYISCLSPLRTAIQGGLSTGTVKIFARLLPDYELTVPHFQGKHSRKGPLQPSSSIHKFAPALASHLPQTNGKVGAVADKVANIAEKLEGVPLIGPYAQTAEKAAHAVGKVAHFFGFTRNSNEQPPMPITNRSVSNVAHIDSADAADSASFMTINEVSIDGALVGTVPEDPLATSSFFNRWTKMDTFSWSSDRASGYVLGSIYVSPSVFHAATSPYSYEYTTTAGYFGLPFQFWRGGMEYLVLIPVSKLHRGSVQILWVPFASTISSNPTNITLNMIYDVAADEEKEVHVGYARELPFLDNRIIQDTTLIIPQGCTNGQLVFRVINPLTSTNATTTTADIIVFARAASDMEFAVPRTTLALTMSTLPVNKEIVTHVSYEGKEIIVSKEYQGALGDEEDHTEQPVVLVPPAASYPMEEILFGERIESIRALLQKPSRLVFTTPESEPFPYALDFPQLGCLIARPSRIGVYSGWTWQNSLRICFTGMAASERYKIFPQGECWVGAEAYTVDVASNPPVAADGYGPSTLAPMTFCGPNKGAEFNIPYYGPVKYILNRFETFARADSSGRLNRIWKMFYSESPNAMVIYHSFGPDIRVTCFRQCPRVRFNSGEFVPTTPWFV